jgi:S1-C subfamily serine protease
MKKIILGLLVLTALFSFGCAGTTVNLKTPMEGFSGPYEAKAVLYFKSFQYSGMHPSPEFLRQNTKISESYALDIFSQIFSEVKIVSNLREVAGTNSSIIVSINFSGWYAPYIKGNANVTVTGKNGQELFSDQNVSSTLNWLGSKKDFQDAMINTFLPIAKKISQSPQVKSYIKSKQFSQYAKQFTESSPAIPTTKPSPRQQQAQTGKESTFPPPKVSTAQSGTGSGFFVSKMGHIITNAHVVKGCNKITVGDSANKQVPAEVVNTDRTNDLALLKLSSLDMVSAETKSLIQKLSISVVPLASKGLLRSGDVKLGEKVLVAGFPFGDFFSNTIKVTTGIVSATRGAGDDSGQFQLDAAVQPGNSGGPIYDSGGNIVGVVISQLDKLKVAKAIGSLPENVNFGIKASTVRQFLISSGLPSKKAEQTEEKSTQQLAEIAQNQALMVMCFQ